MIEAIRGVSSMATRRLLANLGAGYKAETGRSVDFQSTGGLIAAQRVRDGEVFDVVVLAADALEKLEVEHHILPGSRAGFARSATAIATTAGSPHPRLNDEVDVKNAVLSARAIGYSTGPSGVHLLNLIKKWDIEEIVAPRLAAAPPGVPVAALIARGEAEIGFQQLSELMDQPGVEVVDLLPSSIQSITVFSVGVGKSSANVSVSREFCSYLISERAYDGIRRHGMEPA